MKEKAKALKALARLGDALLNLVYSLTLSLATGKPQGVKVPDSLLAEIARRLNVKKRLGMSRASEDELADAIEAIFAAAWLGGIIDLAPLCLELAQGIPRDIPPSRAEALKLITSNLGRILEKLIEEVSVDSCLESFGELLRRRLES